MCNLEQDKPWFIKYTNEDGVDTGGMQRDSLSELCTELQSTVLDLLIPTDNTRDRLGNDQESWTLNLSLVA